MDGCENRDGSNRKRLFLNLFCVFCSLEGLAASAPRSRIWNLVLSNESHTLRICWTFTTRRSWLPVSESLRSDVWRPRYLEAITEQKGERYGNMFMDRNLSLMDMESQWACTIELLFKPVTKHPLHSLTDVSDEYISWILMLVPATSQVVVHTWYQYYRWSLSVISCLLTSFH